MSIKSDKWIRRMAQQHGLIEPFEAGQVRQGESGKLISYGTSSYGYDVRCAREFKIFTNINSTIVDPKHFDEKSFVDVTADVCIIPPNSFALARTVEYFRIPRNVLTVCLGKSTYARCFSGDTRVALVDGTSATLEEMARGSESGKRYWGYSLGEGGRIIVTLLDRPRFIARDALLELTLDNEATIRVTPDHMFWRRNGLKAQAAELRAGDSLMPLYRNLRCGYEYLYQPINGQPYLTHRLADEWNLRNKIYTDEPGTHRQHLDFNRRNNRPDNLKRMDASVHQRMHNAEAFSPNFGGEERGAIIRDALDGLALDPQWRENFARVQTAKARGFCTDELSARMRARMHDARRNPSDPIRQAHPLATWRRFEHPAQRAAHADRMRQVWSNDDGSGRQSRAEVARSINLRPEITPEFVRKALNETGSIGGAARYLNSDRSVFRRFSQDLAQFEGRTLRNHKIVAIRELPGVHDVYCLTVPEAGNFALEAGVFVDNCGIIVNVTPLEPEWEGHVTLEFSNTTTLPAKIYANEGVAQMLFFESDEVCETSYADRGGKYQKQLGVTLPKA